MDSAIRVKDFSNFIHRLAARREGRNDNVIVLKAEAKVDHN